ncbi:hypothetical protein ABMA28_013904 [Loxostege sticticalis]|uniref:Uncharacterized protein n=1 Tax=Loxostege sticticalis TaxID=481309 RepID=A0ABD0TK30_LOXSC
MKFLVAFALIAVASAIPLSPSQLHEVEQIFAAIQSPSTNPATAAALQQMLIDMGVVIVPGKPGQLPINMDPALLPEKPGQLPIHTDPALLPEHPDQLPIHTDPALLPEHPEHSDLPEHPEHSDLPEAPVVAPVFVPEPARKSPLVEIILNVNQANAAIPPVSAGVPEHPGQLPIHMDPALLPEHPGQLPINMDPALLPEKPGQLPINMDPAILPEQPGNLQIVDRPILAPILIAKPNPMLRRTQ